MVALLAFLRSMFCYQVAYGIVIPKALQLTATDASYKWGFKNGKDEWDSCSDADGDCQTGLSDYSAIYYSYTTGYMSQVLLICILLFNLVEVLFSRFQKSLMHLLMLLVVVKLSLDGKNKKKKKRGC